MAGNDDILLRIGADVSDLKRALGEARKETSKTSDVMEGLKTKLLGVAGVLGLGLGFTKLVGDAIQFADAIQKAADQTGMAAESVQFLRYAADQTGASVDGMTNLVGKMQTQLVEAAKGNKDINRTLLDLGLNLEDIRAMSPEQQFAAIATEISKISDPGEKAAAAVELFGKSGKDALPMINAFGEGQEELAANFERIGGPVSAGSIKAVDDMGDAASTAALGIKSAVTELLAMIAPVIVTGLQGLSALIGALRGEAEPAAGSIEALNKKLGDLITTQANQAVVTNMGMGLSLPTSQAARDAIQKEIDATKALIQEKYNQLAVGNAQHTQVAEELADITIVDEARTAALEKERLAREKRLEDMQDARNRELAAELSHQQAILDARIKTSSETTQIETDGLYDQVSINSDARDTIAENAINSLQSMTAGVARENRAMFEINKAAGIASAVVNTAQGVTKALAEYPPPLSFAMAAAQAAAGAAQIAAISKTKFGSGTAPSQAATPATPVAPVGGSGGGGGGGGGGGQDRVMRVQGLGASDIFNGKTARVMAQTLLDFQKDGGQVVFEQ